jgi:RimJ/RimL family protein N-acetyltransferase
MKFREERGISYCGLACVLCRDEDCPGCTAKITSGDDCPTGICAVKKGVDGCYACPDYPCGDKMLQGKRKQAFSRYAQEFGVKALIERLRKNYETGITYHTPDGSTGDYDKLETEEEIYKLLRFGTSDPYKKCPVFVTEHFTLRLVSEEETEDLLCCYADPQTQKIINADNCWGGYDDVSTLEMMQSNVEKWIEAYKYSAFIRFAILDNEKQKAVGTVEMFGDGFIMKEKLGGILRIDIASPYETQEYISELLSLANEQFFALFNVEAIATKAIPDAKERIAALLSAGYKPFEWEAGREHYYIKT